MQGPDTVFLEVESLGPCHSFSAITIPVNYAGPEPPTPDPIYLVNNSKGLRVQVSSNSESDMLLSSDEHITLGRCHLTLPLKDTGASIPLAMAYYNSKLLLDNPTRNDSESGQDA